MKTWTAESIYTSKLYSFLLVIFVVVETCVSTQPMLRGTRSVPNTYDIFCAPSPSSSSALAPAPLRFGTCLFPLCPFLQRVRRNNGCPAGARWRVRSLRGGGWIFRGLQGFPFVRLYAHSVPGLMWHDSLLARWDGSNIIILDCT